ncbi:hypothetical protein ASPCAL05276 [Aspergillus calidoustus]|uniref:Uncharacterized protein n=1 Tax=Aspergillus calidoustus TaxID=454130 RepID=A0A0U5FX57_ASPCI|nr:hypothetical protein ASPCAL05276 [Aspergillus calidoustus]
MYGQLTTSCALHSQNLSQITNCSNYYIYSHPGSGTQTPIPLDLTNHIPMWLSAQNQAQQNTHTNPTSSKPVDLASNRSTSDRDVLRAWIAKFDQALQQIGSSVQGLNVQLNGGDGAGTEMDTDMDLADALPEMMEWLDINAVDVDIEIPDAAPEWDLDGDAAMTDSGSDSDVEEMEIDLD